MYRILNVFCQHGIAYPNTFFQHVPWYTDILAVQYSKSQYILPVCTLIYQISEWTLLHTHTASTHIPPNTHNVTPSPITNPPSYNLKHYTSFLQRLLGTWVAAMVSLALGRKYFSWRLRSLFLLLVVINALFFVYWFVVAHVGINKECLWGVSQAAGVFVGELFVHSYVYRFVYLSIQLFIDLITFYFIFIFTLAALRRLSSVGIHHLRYQNYK